MTKKKLKLKDCQNESLNILISVAKFCDENNLRYYIMGGTLLGAIRHGDFIPWDDDIDIMMPRPDFKKFCVIYKDDRYKVLSTSEGRYNYGKVYDTKTIKYESNVDYKINKPLGIDIDIFVLDGIVNNEVVMKKAYNKIKVLETMLRLANQPLFMRKNKLKAINRIVPRIIGRKNIAKLIEKVQTKYDYDSSDYIIRLRYSTNGFTGIMPKSDYDEPVLVNFDKYQFKAPRNYDKWLTTYYGDYMKMPPKEKQIAHPCEAYYL